MRVFSYFCIMWNNIIGQERVKRVMRSVLEREMLPGAYLFYGPEGIGKDAVAFELAKVVNCLDVRENGTSACDVCASCVQIDALTSPVLTFVCAIPKEPESGGQKDDDVEIIREQLAAKAADKYFNIEIPRALLIQVGQIRELRMGLSKTISGGKRRVVIMSECDMMNAQSQNAFLKTLEEPNKNTILLLTSSNPHRLYPTILSRCQDVRFDPLSEKDIAEALVERDEIPRDQAEFLARLAAGSYSQARAMIGEDIREMRKEIVQFMRMGLSTSRQKALKEIDLFVPRGGGAKFLEKRVAVEQRLTLLSLWLRDALALSTNAAERIINIDQQEDLQKFVGKFGYPNKIINAIRAVEKAQSEARAQLQLRPVMLNLVMELEAALL